MQAPVDIEDINKHVEHDPAVIRKIMCELYAEYINEPSIVDTSDLFMRRVYRICRKYKCCPPKNELGQAYKELIVEPDSQIKAHDQLMRALIKRAVRSESGIINISVVMPPDKFSCKYNCRFCPNEPGMPRSYLSNEDAVKRANSVQFDAVSQVYTRFETLETNGHSIDKIEFRILGGTFSSYDHTLADTFIRDLYYAANNYYSTEVQIGRGTLEEEIERNSRPETKIHVVGLGLETRPDEITPDELRRFRRYGCTRVELGVQHTDDKLLRLMNRGHRVQDSRNAIQLLKNSGFKIEIHIMADLPNATPEGDKQCYFEILQGDPGLIPDYMKDYPCLDVAFTEIKQWKESGKWQPYSEGPDGVNVLQDVLVYRQSITPKYVRVNRVQRDFSPATEDNEYLGYTSSTISSNLGQIVKDRAEQMGVYCKCIRCCELGNEKFNIADVEYKTVVFYASNAIEYFISAEIDRPHRPLLLGFIRLRIMNEYDHPVFPELSGNTAIIRELHVYGSVVPVSPLVAKDVDRAQHRGIGKHLMEMAEKVASRQHFKNRIAVIAGVGVRGYYEKRGYQLEGTYMVKQLPPFMVLNLQFGVIMCLIAIFIAYLLV
jgi:ELP3 family radical SAM enzyme/protein acetyltransferase